ncbi:MAG: hypothetical protein RL885_27730 [Planctomycetota bacterium]
MSSNDAADRLDLDRDLPTTERDVEALRACRTLPRLDLEAYLAFLEAMGPLPQEELRKRRGPRGDQVFEVL